jgi:hypothetical protein
LLGRLDVDELPQDRVAMRARVLVQELQLGRDRKAFTFLIFA